MMKKLNYFLGILAVIVVAVACKPKSCIEFTVGGDDSETKVKISDSLSYVVLSKPQVTNFDQAPKDKDGFISLFNGKDFNGWRGYDRNDMPGKWSIENGAIKISGSGTGEAHSSDGGDIIFARKFKNFELSFEWKVDKGSNSGVFYMAQEIKGQPIWISAPEYQILDNINHPDAQLGVNGNRQSASLYDMIPADPQNAKPIGEWNQGGIMVYKGTVVHKQNGKNVLEYHLWTPKWNELIANSKFKPGGDYPLAYSLLTNLGGDNKEGYIGLQDHGDNVWYKNIRIKILE